jgi:hypothetical protein
MKLVGFNFVHGSTVHSVDLRLSGTKKLGYAFIVQTYHFDIEQVINNNLVLDSGTCFNCPLSFNQNNGKTGGCYTHKGNLRRGLGSKLRSLNKQYKTGKLLNNYDTVLSGLNKFAKDVKISLVRFGTYGEAVTLPLDLLDGLAKLSKRKTGYTHQWNKPEYKDYSKFLMASTHNVFEVNIAKDYGFRTFNVGKIENSVMCPSSPTIKKIDRTPCSDCGLCAGNSIEAKDIYIPKH